MLIIDLYNENLLMYFTFFLQSLAVDAVVTVNVTKEIVLKDVKVNAVYHVEVSSNNIICGEF